MYKKKIAVIGSDKDFHQFKLTVSYVDHDAFTLVRREEDTRGAEFAQVIRLPSANDLPGINEIYESALQRLR